MDNRRIGRFIPEPIKQTNNNIKINKIYKFNHKELGKGIQGKVIALYKNTACIEILKNQPVESKHYMVRLKGRVIVKYSELKEV